MIRSLLAAYRAAKLRRRNPDRAWFKRLDRDLRVRGWQYHDVNVPRLRLALREAQAAGRTFGELDEAITSMNQVSGAGGFRYGGTEGYYGWADLWAQTNFSPERYDSIMALRREFYHCGWDGTPAKFVRMAAVGVDLDYMRALTFGGIEDFGVIARLWAARAPVEYVLAGA